MEFENLQIEVPTGENNSSYLGVKVFEKKYHNTDKGFVIGFDPNSKENIERKQKRAKRFGNKQIETTEIETTTTATDNEKKKEQLSDIEKFIKLDFKTIEWPPIPAEANEEIRPDAILLYGVDHMSTTDVFEYFKLFGPESIEWIDDFSCNVVWEDKSTVINALDTLSRTYGKLLELQRKATLPPANTSRPNTPVVPIILKEEDDDEEITSYENQVVVEDDEEIDPKDIWRVGLPFRGNQLFLRYATVKDRKLPGAAQRSEFYLKYGRNPANTKNGVEGVLSKSRKRKLQQMQKLAEERFKTKEPDVKIVDLADLKAEGIISKMEVDDEEDEPVVKRLNVDHTEERMTMVADKVEVQQRLGDRYDGDTVHDRLGAPLRNGDREERSGRVHDRLGTVRLDGIGRRNNHVQSDARDELLSNNRRTHNNQTYIHGDGYIDDYGDYHDIYRASDNLKDEDDDDNKDKLEKQRIEICFNNDSYESDYDNNQSSNIRGRLGLSNGGGGSRPSTPPVSDLRDKLRRKGKDRQRQPLTQQRAVEEDPQDSITEPVLEDSIKDEIDGGKLNLCIEIKQEPQDSSLSSPAVSTKKAIVKPVETPMDEEDFEF